jgi:hypothetical protein
MNQIRLIIYGICIKQKVKEYRETTNYVVSPEKIKEKNKKAYLKRKEKLKVTRKSKTK